MIEKEVYFAGILANTDESILKIHLENGFQIEKLSSDEGLIFIANLERYSAVYNIVQRISMEYPCLNREKQEYCFIKNTIPGKLTLDEQYRMVEACPEMFSDFKNKIVEDYLNQILRLMRLFKDGNICMPFEYYYVYDEKNIPRRVMSSGSAPWKAKYSTEKYTLSDKESEDLEIFIKQTRLPFQNYLELAFENYELSYEIHNIGLGFLTLMISLEVMFNPSKQEVKHRVSRNTAVLLGSNYDETENIYSKIKDFYDKRSHLVHSGSAKIVNPEDLAQLRNYVRNAIKKIYRLGIAKDDLLEKLDRLGFGGKLVDNIEEK
jgi:hypothetical protein